MPAIVTGLRPVSRAVRFARPALAAASSSSRERDRIVGQARRLPPSFPKPARLWRVALRNASLSYSPMFAKGRIRRGGPLERFHEAQSSPTAGYDTALAEIRRGHKTSHWIWSIFPQLAGLGRSSTVRAYAIRDLAEAGECLTVDLPALPPTIAKSLIHRLAK